MSDDIAFHCYVPDMIPCPNCQMCKEHEDKAPRLKVRTRYYRVMQDGTRIQLTKEEYDRRLQ